MTIRSTVAAAVLAAGLWAGQAGADITFTYTSTSSDPRQSFSFTLPDSFVPATYTATQFTTGQVTDTTSNGIAPIFPFDDYTFYSADAPTGSGFDSLYNVYEGPAVFTGPTSAPTFLNGIYAYDDFEFDGTLVISGAADAPGAAVPEPATWGTMLVGLALVGTAVRRRRVRVAFA